MLASVVAGLVATAFLRDSLMTEKLTRRGVRVGAELHVDVLRTTLVGDVMARAVKTISADSTVDRAAEVMSRGGHGAYPVVDEAGRCVAMVERRELLVADVPEGGTVLDLANRDVVSVTSSTSLVETLELMLVEGVDHLPVIDRSQLVGICTTADIIRARGDQLAMEHREHGWLRPVLSRRRPRRLLVVGNRTLGDPAILQTIGQRVGTGRVTVHVVAPTGPTSEDGARGRLEDQLTALRAAGWT